MDRITQSLIENFLKTEEINESNQSTQFEMFCNYSIVSNEYNKTFDCKAINIGGGDDTGIDGIAIIVNGHLIEDIDEIEDLKNTNGYLEVTYLFIQAKTSANFNTSEMQTFYFGVKDFFSTTPGLRRNKDIEKFSELSNYILNNATYLRENPTCKLFYITTGRWNDTDLNLNTIKKSIILDLENLNLFENVESHTFGANDINKLYRKSQNPISTTFNFANKVTLDGIHGINQSYYGVIPFLELKKILVNDNGSINRVFDDNVRDFQGIDNLVNANIDETLNSDNPYLFSVLNNGITIVASTIRTNANTFTIEDYQIVNGCQTSNVLYNHRNNSNLDKLSIPLRLIITEDEDVKAKITVSTNNQTAIKREQLAAMSNFQKDLEAYYAARYIDKDEGKLYYERRSKQYNNDGNVIKRRIITIPNQVKSFSAIFLKNPEKVTSFYGSIVKDLGEKTSNIFAPNHKFSPYYLSGLAFYRLDMLFSNGTIPASYKKIRYFILMLFLKFASNNLNVPQFNSNQIDTFCENIIKKLNNIDKCKEIFLSVISLIDASEFDIEDKRYIKSVGSTKDLLDYFEQNFED